MNINKSKYCGYCQCPKLVWLKKNKSEEFVVDEDVLERASISNEICKLQRKLFGKHVDILSLVDDVANIEKLVNKTNEVLNSKAKVIVDASFEFDGAYCVVDILKKEDVGYSIYRTKSSTKPNQHAYMVEIAFQKYILQKCGINVVNTYVINVNTKYDFKYKLNLNKLFKVTNVTELVDQEFKKVENNICNLKTTLEMKEEPKIDLNAGCHSPYTCGFWQYCSKHLPNPSVFDLYATSIQKKIEYYNKGIITFEDIKSQCISLDCIQNMQIEHTLENKETMFDKENVDKFLNKLWYPLYFLDFETVQTGIPIYKKSRPYQPIPFQYSLHYIEKPNGEIKHKECLVEPFKDPRKQIAKSLLKDIPTNACVLAFNKFFEGDRIRDLAKLFQSKRKKLLAISKNIFDLMDPFSNGYVYNKNMGNSLSIKSILPALYPNDPSLNYENLNGVNNGNDAMVIFQKMKNMTVDEREKAKRELLEYCKLDTYAMVKIFEYLTNHNNLT